MPATLYLRPSPRAFFLLTSTHALVFRQPSREETKAAKSVVVAEYLPLEEVDQRGLIKAGKAEGVLGVVSIPSERSPIPEIFLLLLTYSTHLPPLIPSSSLRPSKIVSVEFHSLSSPYWDGPELANAANALDYEDEYDDLSATYAAAGGSQQTLSAAQREGVSHPCSGMKKYLESLSFFHAESCRWDISSRLSSSSNWIKEATLTAGHPLENYDERFVWNKSLLEPFLEFRKGLGEEMRKDLDEAALLLPIIQGFCGSLPISTGGFSNGKPSNASLGLISRLSWKRAGARFRTRGIDDDGQVANFVETEILLAVDGAVMSYVQVRGSVPLFWQQPSQGIQTLQQRVEITRPPAASQPAFDRHFIELLEHYNSIHAINLLGQKDAEAMLSSAYSSHLAALKKTLENTPASEKENMDAEPRGTLNLTPYDFHSAVRAGGHDAVRYDMDRGCADVVRSRGKFEWTVVDMGTGDVVEEQKGAFRTNCLDCLDRTNYVQDVLSSLTLTDFLRSIGSPLLSSPTLWAAHRELWADNGDRLSKIYAGTGAINTSATRSGKKTFAGLLSDATKSVSRAYVNNFQDKGKQAAIDLLLGMMSGQRPVILYDPISECVQAALSERLHEYSTNKQVTVFSGTWNLNGKAPDEALDPWLFPPNTADPDIYMIAFQEIVELSAGQILQTDPAKKRRWEKFIMDTFQMHKKDEYILYRSDQLVGTALIVIIKKHLVPHLRNVESATKKTGLQGLSGNKGGVAIRFNLYDSSICFVTCHLAAGHGNVADRNADWRTVVGGLKFLRGKMIGDHEVVIWGADFNYRVSMTNAEVRELIENNDIDALLGADQLMHAIDNGEVFLGYDEGPIRFRPTYKYDNGTENYDTSEKQRIPAWTDRILFKGPALRLKEYSRAELMTSDHRPVYAVFEATIREVDYVKKEAIAKDLMHELLKGDVKEKIGKRVGVEVGSEIAKDSVRGMAKVDVPTSLRVERSPRLPPRTGSSSSLHEKGNPTLATGRVRSISSLQPPSTSASTSLRALATSQSSSSRSSGRKSTPPLPPRPSYSPVSSKSQTSSTKLGPTRLQAPPAPPSRSLHVTPDPTGSSASAKTSPLKPTFTGDFVVVPQPSGDNARRAPPLPPRAGVSPRKSDSSMFVSTTSVRDRINNINVSRPTGLAHAGLKPPRKSLDLNGSPPKGLMSPARPDVINVEGRAPPPPSPRQIPIESATSTVSAETKYGEDKDVRAKSEEAKLGESLKEATSELMPFLPTKKSKPPPTVPKKPVALRGDSATGEEK